MLGSPFQVARFATRGEPVQAMPPRCPCLPLISIWVAGAVCCTSRKMCGYECMRTSVMREARQSKCYKQYVNAKHVLARAVVAAHVV